MLARKPRLRIAFSFLSAANRELRRPHYRLEAKNHRIAVVLKAMLKSADANPLNFKRNAGSQEATATEVKNLAFVHFKIESEAA